MPDVFIEHNLDEWLRLLKILPEQMRIKAITPVSKQIGRELMRRFQRTVQTWRHRPRFEVLEEVGPNQVSVLAGTDDEIYNYVDKGTRPHIIEPKGTGYPLRFQSMYQAKTIPGVIGSQQGGPSGPYVGAYRVRHPGTRARRFTEVIFKEVEPMGWRLLTRLIHKVVVENVRRVARNGPQGGR